ncbi:MAG: hypothetical protein U5R06_04195 [candidate division KSB1 bacterium]|nr:hypothetical protein [candidate division KSB1 bacterium]
MKKTWVKPSLKILVHNHEQENLILGDCTGSNLSQQNEIGQCDVENSCGSVCSSAV